MPKFRIWLSGVTAIVNLQQIVTAENENEARRIFVSRIGQWESTAPRNMPNVEMTHSLIPNRDYNGEQIEIAPEEENEDE